MTSKLNQFRCGRTFLAQVSADVVVGIISFVTAHFVRVCVYGLREGGGCQIQRKKRPEQKTEFIDHFLVRIFPLCAIFSHYQLHKFGENTASAARCPMHAPHRIRNNKFKFWVKHVCCALTVHSVFVRMNSWCFAITRKFINLNTSRRALDEITCSKCVHALVVYIK